MLESVKHPGQGFQIVPVLQVADVAAATAQLQTLFGFAGAHGRIALKNQTVVLQEVPGFAPDGYGPFDHIAFEVRNVDAGLAAVLGQGGAIDPANTPDGPVEIPEFWAAGARYAFMLGPQRSRFEFCLRNDADPTRRPDVAGNTLGHDHIGLSCTDIAASAQFYIGLGFGSMGAFTLDRPGGPVFAHFVTRGDYTIELFSLPAVRAGQLRYGQRPVIAALRLEGSGLPPARMIGPDGEVIEIV